MFTKEEFKKVVNVPLAVLIASFIIIIITTGIPNANGLSALIGGYSGLLLGLLFLIILNFPLSNIMDIFPFIIVIIIISLMMYYLITNFDQIAKGQVSNYYSSFSILSTIFLAAQILIILTAIMKSDGDINRKIFSPRIFALLNLFGVINFIIIITLGIILHFYSTQG
jgi:uncharacterized membrane protein